MEQQELLLPNKNYLLEKDGRSYFLQVTERKDINGYNGLIITPYFQELYSQRFLSMLSIFVNYRHNYKIEGNNMLILNSANYENLNGSFAFRVGNMYN